MEIEREITDSGGQWQGDETRGVYFFWLGSSTALIGGRRSGVMC